MMMMWSTVTSHWKHWPLPQGGRKMWEKYPSAFGSFISLVEEWHHLEGIPWKWATQGHCNSNRDSHSLTSKLSEITPCSKSLSQNAAAAEKLGLRTPHHHLPWPPPAPPISSDGWTNWYGMIGPFILICNSGFHIQESAPLCNEQDGATLGK